MRLATRRRIAWVAAAAIGGCSSLDVTNTNAPDIDRVFSQPAAIEQAIGSGYLSCHNAVQDVAIQARNVKADVLLLSLEVYSSGGDRVPIPRGPINSRAGAFNAGSGVDFENLTLGARLSANSVAALDRLTARGGTLGSNAQNLRARAFGFFAVGCHQGWLAMEYDSSAVVTPATPADFVPSFSGAHTVMTAAIAMFDSALAIVADSAAVVQTGGFSLPASWMNDKALSRAEFIRLVRSYRARFRAGVARTPTERQAVNWSAVIADAENGIAADFLVTVSAASGWLGGAVGGTTAPSMVSFYYGMAETSGSYDAWLAKPLEQRSAFLVRTPDRRWPQGTTDAQQRTSSIPAVDLTSRPYIANRAASLDVYAWGLSSYAFNRLAYIRTNANNSGAYPEIIRAEMDLLAAEGYLQTGNITAAAAKIDVTRVGRGQLPALVGVITQLGQPVPGGSGCVPRVPIGPAYTSTRCGDIREAMKWEKRMETALTGHAQWYFDSRGWGDLIANTATEFPVPSTELAARHKPDYALGGGYKSSAAKGTYGF